MNNTRRLWRITGLVGLISTILFMTGFVYGIRTVLYPTGEELTEPATEAPAMEEGNNKEKLQILALGDSLSKGVGDEEGEGYVGKVKKQLEQQTDKPVYVWNFAVNGAVTTDLLNEINKPTAADYIKQADIILFTIGGNDLNRMLLGGAGAQGSAANGAAGTMPNEIRINFTELAKGLPDVVKRFNDIIDRLAGLNPNAQIVYVSLYHPYLEFDPERVGMMWLGNWNKEVFQAANRYPNVTIVPTYDFFQNNWRNLLYSDHFHPNGAGYEEMASRVMQVLKGLGGDAE